MNNVDICGDFDDSQEARILCECVVIVALFIATLNWLCEYRKQGCISCILIVIIKIG